jgi:hypothetical protein
MNLDLEHFNKIEDGNIIMVGQIENSPDKIYMTDMNIGKMLLWVAKKGFGNDWTIYTHWAENGINNVLTNGDKIINKEYIKKLTNCTDEILNLYRY